MSWEQWREFYWNAKALESLIGIVALAIILTIVLAALTFKVLRHLWRNR